MVSNKLKIFTIGHSTHPIEEFVGMLNDFHIRKLIDVRTIPRSRFNPQFNREALGAFLAGQGLGYRHMEPLGGLRHARKDSINAGWRNASFRGYADYMQTPSFEAALEDLIEEARAQTVAIMCAEAVPWRCHRSLIADALVTRKIAVENIMGRGKSSPHKINPMAKVDQGRIYYPQAVA